MILSPVEGDPVASMCGSDPFGSDRAGWSPAQKTRGVDGGAACEAGADGAAVCIEPVACTTSLRPDVVDEVPLDLSSHAARSMQDTHKKAPRTAEFRAIAIARITVDNPPTRRTRSG